MQFEIVRNLGFSEMRKCGENGGTVVLALLLGRGPAVCYCYYVLGV